MPVIDETVVIARSAAEVFDFLMIATNLPRWDSSMLECGQVGGGAVTVGTRYRGASKILGRRIEWTTEVVEFVPGVRAASQSVEGPLTFTVSYEVSASPAGTTLRYRLAAESGLGGAFGRAMEPIVQRAQTKVVRANLDTLASLLEQRAA
ncbi:MAG TPA: SRPBCC family protein [Streptosporangiaceae bacterium]|nr:SRPBCC family protein [Streptosporangiaceae bacterium]